MRNRIFILVFITAILSLSSFIQAKDESNKPSPKLRRWSISWSTGPASSGIAAEIEKAMIASGYNDTTPIFMLPHPVSWTKYGDVGKPWAISIHYVVKPPFLIGAFISKATMGMTAGFHEVNAPLWPWDGSSLSIYYSVNTYAPVFSVCYRIIQLGVGPAWHVARARPSMPGISGQANTVNKLGFIADLGITVPERTRFYLEFKAQYRWIGQVEIGPYEDKVETAFGYETVIFPKTGVNYSRRYVGVGIGIRF